MDDLGIRPGYSGDLDEGYESPAPTAARWSKDGLGIERGGCEGYGGCGKKGIMD